jgi:hypothetical protein
MHRPLVALCLTLVALSAAPARAAETTLTDLQARLDAARDAWRGVKSYTCTMIKQERVEGELLDEETVFTKLRHRPFSVYMKWTRDPHEGREVLYREGWNDGEIKGHEGGLLGVVNLNLDPRGDRAMDGNRHSVLEAGVGKIIKLLRENVALAILSGEGQVEDLGPVTLHGMKLHGYKLTLPAGKVKRGLIHDPKRYYSADLRLFLEPSKNLPVGMEARDAKGRLLETYGYTKLRLNPGLNDRDFDPDHDDYRF